MAFFNFAAFLIMRKKWWQNSQRFDVCGKIQGVKTKLGLTIKFKETLRKLGVKKTRKKEEN